MISFARRRVAALAFVLPMLLYANAAIAIEGVFGDSGYFGIRGSISESTALVGQRFGGSEGNGEVRVFDIVDSAWLEAGTSLGDALAAAGRSLSVGADFGAGALAVDGNTAIAAAYRNQVAGASEAGSVFLFSRSQGQWTCTAEWNEPGATTPTPNAHFGIGGDLSDDEALVLAGGTNKAYVYSRFDGVWNAGVALTGGNLNMPIAGAIDQGVAAVGSFLGDTRVDVWRRAGEAWAHDAALANPGTTGNYFAADLDISGNTMVVSAYGQTVGDQGGAGAVYIYEYDGQTWGLAQTIENPAPVAGDAFGYSVALKGDRLVVGTPRYDASGNTDAGAAYLFQRTGSTWTQIEQCVPNHPTTGQWFGEAVSVDDFSLLVGGSGRASGGQGIAQLDGPTSVRLPGDANRDGSINAADAAILAAHWGDQTGVSWATGDFNEDGAVNALDASILAANWSGVPTESSSATTVPEPGTLTILATGLIALATFLRRRV
ncbi:MAG TPA: dockerin type I domain-containing protein [Thermoguttaceae bacterium]|nr:dockerin type I domain-containing protein [Thermoguttaceae bacterium]